MYLYLKLGAGLTSGQKPSIPLYTMCEYKYLPRVFGYRLLVILRG